MWPCQGRCVPTVGPVGAVGAAVAIPPGPPPSCDNLGQRDKIDRRLKQVATEVRGTAATPIYIIDGFVDPEDCAGVMDENRTKLEKSPLTRYDPEDPGFRTSSTAFFDGQPAEKRVQRRVLDLLNVPDQSAESGQVQNYQVGQHFRPHVDAFHAGLDDEPLKQGQRTWTTIVYLNDADGGGQTKFVNMGEEIEPRAGRAVVWSSLTPEGEIDDQTLHEGTDVTSGQKWIATVWARDQCTQPGMFGGDDVGTG